MKDSGIRLRYRHHYSDFRLELDLHLPGGGITALFGPSGSGKTTLLRCIAGLETPELGFFRINGQAWQNDAFTLPAHKRPLGYVFQEASLLPHLTARGNLDFARKRSGQPNDRLHLESVLTLLGIHHLLDRPAHQLSGGERQRVAIARALLIRPQLLLMDEPLAGLDHPRKQEILPYLEKLHRELTIPIIYVSHSPEEVARLADHLVVMEEGHAPTAGPLGETLARVDPPLAMGDNTGVVWEAQVAELDRHWQLARATFAGGQLWIRDSGLVTRQPLRLRILANDVSLALQRHTDSSILNLLPGTVTEIAPDDNGTALVKVDVEGSALLSRLTRRSVDHLQLAPGKPVWAQVKSVALLR